jgi:two-component system chemotaxis response regulator CheB
MPTRDIVVIGASAGGVPTLKEFVRLLPADYPGAILLVQHLSAAGGSWLPQILTRSGVLTASFPMDREPLQFGHITVAPPDHHLLVDGDRVRVVRGPRENRHRPAIDPLFRSAAWAFGPRVVGVVLTGYLDDGAAGLWAIKSCGGLAIVQDASDALHHDMPTNAARAMDVDYSLPVSEIVPLLARLAQEEVTLDPGMARPSNIKTEVEFAAMDRDITDMDKLGTLSPFTCPSCRGALWELQDGDVLRYRCHTGHAFSRDSLLGEQEIAIEEALYAALRAVEEKATALRKLSERHAGRSEALEKEFEGKAEELDGTADVLRSMLAGRPV